MFRVLRLLPLLPLASRAPAYGRLLWALVSDPRVPMARKALLGLAGAYVVSPFDLVPDRIPFVGMLDDAAVMVLAIDAFLEGLPTELVKEKLDELGIPQADLDADLAKVRRLVPGPIRWAVDRLPDAISAVSRRLFAPQMEEGTA
jgi:uncharacterized membrane protein YkvA (DUF1232 family)